jgi:putative pyruvate formate lyase activating enzyme
MNPGYLDLYHSGELQKRAARLSARLAACDLCPRNCGVNRLAGEEGFCHSGALPLVSSFCAHRGEEPALSGEHGSGTIFFSNCNLRCVYCQNFQISQNPDGQITNAVSLHTLADYMLNLQQQGCHNINLVSPTHFIAQILEALSLAIAGGLRLPLVYNTNAYERLDVLRELEGVVDIYLPDIKYAEDNAAIKYSSARGYPKTARLAIREMWRQVGALITGGDGIAERGLIVRHLILPEGVSGTQSSLTWLAELSTELTLSLMSQYYPAHHASRYAALGRPITAAEHEAALRFLEEAGLENGWIQDLESPGNYRPDFERPGHPFENAV